MATKIRGNSQIMTGTVDFAKLKTNFLEDIALTGGYHIWQMTSDNTGILRGLADPLQSQDAATKAYVDSVATGLDVKKSVRVGTKGNITLSGLQTIDGVALVAGDRVLVMQQTNKSENGIYSAASGAWARSADADNLPGGGEVTAGMFTFIEEGSTLANTGYALVTVDPITLGTSELEFAQFSGAGTYTAGDGLDLNGTVFSVDITDFIDTAAGIMEDGSNNIQVNLGANGGLKFSSGAIVVEPSNFINTAKGLSDVSDAIEINLHSTSGLAFDGASGALMAVGGDGVKVDGNGIALDIQSNKGLALTSLDGTGQLYIDTHDGLTTDADGLKVVLTVDAGLEFAGLSGSRTIGVKIGSGIQLVSGAVSAKVYDGIINDATNGLTFRITTNGGLEFDTAASGSKGVKVKVDDSTIAIDASGNVIVKDNGITTAKIIDGNVTAAKIGLDAVNASHIDWGTGANQINADTIPYTPAAGSGFQSATDTVKEALDELASALGAEVTGEEPAVTAGNAAVGALAAPDSGKAIDDSSLKVYLNGIRVAKGSGKDFTYNTTSRVITFEYELASGDTVLVDYRIINAA